MKKLYRFAWDVRRMGRVQGTFIADDSEVAAAIGREVNFGEILGKHSEIYGTIEAGEIVEVTDDQDFIAKAEKYGVGATGYNPLEYFREDEEEESDDEANEPC